KLWARNRAQAKLDSMATIAEVLSIALGHQQKGELSTAEQIYRQILTADPNSADAWRGLGIIANQTGRPQEAIKYILQAPDVGAAPATVARLLESQMVTGPGPKRSPR